MALRFGKLEDALLAAGASAEKAAEAAEEVHAQGLFWLRAR
jgi:hypothetical protein